MTIYGLISHIFISVFFAAGFITLYELHVQWAFATNATTTRNRLKRATITGSTLLLCIILQFVIFSDIADHHLFMNIQLFVIAYPLLNDRFSSLEFWTQGTIGGIFWFLNHPFDSALFGIVALALITLGLSLRYFRRFIRYGWWAHFGYGLALSVTYWFSFTDMTQITKLIYMGLFLLMCTYSWGYSNFTFHRRQERERLKREVNYDALTQVKSYTSYINESKSTFTEAQTAHEPLTFIELDLDNFKAINDQFSHLAGNGALTHAATTLNTVLTHSGAKYELYRTGGEEFVMLFCAHHIDTVLPIIKECLAAIRATQYQYNHQLINLTASLGVTELRPDDIVMDDLYSRADDSLYISKQHGRNCITVNDETLDVHQLATTVVTNTFFTQPVIALSDRQPVCHEIVMRTYNHGRWMAPDQASMNTTVQLSMAHRLLQELPVSSLAINLTLDQFMDLTEAARLIHFVRHNDAVSYFAVELLEVPTLEQLIALGAQYRQAGILLFINDNRVLRDETTFKKLIPYLDGLKLNLHHLPRGYQFIISQYQDLMTQHHKVFILEGIETQQDYQEMCQLKVHFGQGYYFSRPVMPRMM